MAESLAGLRIVLVGPGRVGSSLARWAIDRGAHLVAIAGRDRRRAHHWNLLPTDTPWRDLAAVHSDDADLLLLAVSDTALVSSDGSPGPLPGDLSRRPQAPVALHTGGAFDRSVLAPLAASRGDAPATSIGSLHPLKAFARATAVCDEPFFALDGEPAALALASRLADAFGGRWRAIDGESRLLYHLAASLAAGGVTTVLALAESLAQRAGLPQEVQAGYLDLARGAIDSVVAGRPVAEAITGPAARGESDLVARQLDASQSVLPEDRGLLDRLLQASTRLAARARSERSE